MSLMSYRHDLYLSTNPPPAKDEYLNSIIIYNGWSEVIVESDKFHIQLNTIKTGPRDPSNPRQM